MPLYTIGRALYAVGGRLLTACCCTPPPPPDAWDCNGRGSCIPVAIGPYATLEECQENCPECEEDGDCPAGQKCCDGVCCQCCDGELCPNGQPCVNCMCEPECETDLDCDECQICENGNCVPCPIGWECIDGECWPPPPERYYCCTYTVTGSDGSQVSKTRCQKGPCRDGMTTAGGPYRTYAQCCESGCGCRYKCDPGSGECSPEEQGQYDEVQKCRDACEPPGDRGACCYTIPPGTAKNPGPCAKKGCEGETTRDQCQSSDDVYRVWKRGMKCNTCPTDEQNVCCKPRDDNPCEVECFETCTQECEDKGGKSNPRFRSCGDDHPLYGTPPCKPITSGGPEGACCYPDNAGCDVVPQCDCITNGGEFKGEGTTCNPDPCGCEEDSDCPEGQVCCDGECCDADNCCNDTCHEGPVGACCIDGECIECYSAAECAQYGGTYQGDGASCEGVTCPTPPCCAVLKGHHLALDGSTPASGSCDVAPCTPCEQAGPGLSVYSRDAAWNVSNVMLTSLFESADGLTFHGTLSNQMVFFAGCTAFMGNGVRSWPFSVPMVDGCPSGTPAFGQSQAGGFYGGLVPEEIPSLTFQKCQNPLP